MTTLPAPVDAGEIQDNSALPLSQAFQDAMAAARGFALAEKADATRKIYRSNFEAFARWCESVGARPLPAEVSTVGAYLAHLASQKKKVSTIDRVAAAIGYAHRLRGAPSPLAAEPVKAVLRGIRRRAGVAVERKAPATARAITAMLKRIDVSTLRGKRDRALLLLGFAAALRRSELVALDVFDLEPTSGGTFVHIRQSKTDQEGAGHSVAIPSGGKLKVLEAIKEWIEAAGLEDNGPLFRSIAKGGRLGGRLTDQSVAHIVKQAAKAAKLDPATFSGHSLRAGFVTSALEAGADVMKVMDVTRHTQVQTLKGYDRRAKAWRDHAGRGFL